MRWFSRCLKTTHGGAVASEETVEAKWLEKEGFEKVFWGLAFRAGFEQGIKWSLPRHEVTEAEVFSH